MKIEGNPVRVLYGYGLRSRHCVHLRVFALELAAAGVAREGHGVSDVGHARDETHEPLEAEAVAAVRHLVRVRVRARVRVGGERASGGFIPGTGDSGVETGIWW